MRRRALLVFAAMMVAALWVLAGCGGEGDGGGEQEEGAAITGEFVGETRDADAFVAVVAEEPREGGGGAREVRAYLCDGESINVWLTGTPDMRPIGNPGLGSVVRRQKRGPGLMPRPSRIT